VSGGGREDADTGQGIKVLVEELSIQLGYKSVNELLEKSYQMGNDVGFGIRTP
jgi:hypothetical protein